MLARLADFAAPFRFDLKAMALRVKRRTRNVVLRPIISTKAQADSLAAIFARMLKPLDVAADLIAALYERELQRVLAHDSADDLNETAEAINREINRLVLELTPDLRDWAFRQEKWHRDKWARAILAGLQVNVETMLGPQDMAETIAQFLLRNTSLIRNVSDEARGRIADAVLRGIQHRTPTAEVTKEIRTATGMARARARRIAADQAVKLSSALDRERQRQAGIDSWKWRHSHKLHPRPIHQARDGNIYTDETAPDDEPGELPFCGCVRQAVLIFEDD